MDSKASLTAAVIMLGSIKALTAVPMLVMTMIIDIWLSAALFSDCGRIEDLHKINSRINKKMRDPAHKMMGAISRQKG